MLREPQMQNGIWMVAVLMLTSSVANATDELPWTELDNPVERILLCTPQGPLIVQLSLTIEGQPFRRETETVIDDQFELMAGSRSWKSAVSNRLLQAGLFARCRTFQALDQLIEEHDRDADGLISRSEVRSVLLQSSTGESLQFIRSRAEITPDEQILSLIDRDGNWRLTADELEHAHDNLLRADYSGDGSIQAGELARAVPRPKSQVDTVAILLRRAHVCQIVQQLRLHYADADGKITRRAFRIAPALFDRLDVDRDGELQEQELRQIVGLPGHLMLAIDHVDDAERKPMVFRPKGVSPELRMWEDESYSPEAFRRWSGDNGELEIQCSLAGERDHVARIAADLISRSDDRRRGYLDLKDAMAASHAYGILVKDLDGDGRIVQGELEIAFLRQAAISRCWIQGEIARHPARLWDRIDANRDELLAVRELRKLREVLAELDVDHDGEVAYDEMPFWIGMQIGRGKMPIMQRRAQPLRHADRDARSPRLDLKRHVVWAPLWFERMDANRDGDISQREFLGTAEQFEKFDADRDGLIDAREAAAVRR